MSVVAKFLNNEDGRFDNEKPYIYSGPEIEGFPNSNLIFKEGPLSITDIRTIPDFKTTVESHGFSFFEYESKELTGVTDEAHAQGYAMEMAGVLKELLGASKVVPLHARLRSSNGENTTAEPGTEAHIDTTLFDAWGRIAALITQQERDDVLAGRSRARIMNLWRPMINHAEDFPLAMLDPTSIDYDKDGMALDHVMPGYCAETVYLKYNPGHKWYWMSNMTPKDAVVFTQYDTHPPNDAFNHVGHVSFRNPEARPGCPPRRSIETRFTVIEPAPYTKPTTVADPRPAETRKQPWRDFIDMAERPAIWKATFEGEETEVKA